RFIVDCMKMQGVTESHAGQLADVLIEADVRGHYSHGLNRLDMYIGDCVKKVCRLDGTPTILKERAGSAWVDGNNLLGPVVGNFSMDLAVKKAKEAGVGWVVAKGSLYCLLYQAMSFTNTSPVTYPTRSARPALGTNPLCLGADGTGGDSFVLDMATTTVAIGKIEIAKRRSEKVPETWGVDKSGRVSTNPEAILDGGGLLPLGGSEVTGGYKGYGLGALVEIFCGILAGSHWGPHIRKWMSASTEADLGQCFIAIDPQAFAPGFHERMQDFINTMRNLPPTDEGLNVEVAGDMERKHIKLVEELGGIPYHPNQI
ncbi:hypothetical protein Angca_007218, partial [Angiostrongylus cantonensis]